MKIEYRNIKRCQQLTEYVMRSLLLFIIVAAFGIEVKAESGAHNVFVDFFGSSNIISVNYDSRFPGTSVFGWRAGVGYSESRFEGHGGWFGNNRPGVSLPLGINALAFFFG